MFKPTIIIIIIISSSSILLRFAHRYTKPEWCLPFK